MHLPLSLVRSADTVQRSTSGLQTVDPNECRCLQRKQRGGGYATTSTQEQFMTKNPTYAAETGAPSGGVGGGGPVTGLKTDEIVRVLNLGHPSCGLCA